MWNIVTDSSCDDLNFEHSATDIRYDSVPFYIHTDHREFVDDGSIDTEELIAVMSKSKIARTACPSPDLWLKHFQRPGNALAFTLSSALSGSYSSARTAELMAKEADPNRNIAVIDSLAEGPSITLLIRAVTRMIEAGMDFDSIVKKANALRARIHIIYALSSFDNLVKNGRMSRMTGFVANALGFWGVGIASPEGRIAIKGKVRGTKRVLNSILNDMKEKGSAIQEVVIVHCLNLPMAQALKDMIIAAFGDLPVTIFPTGGLATFYAEKNGLIVSYRCAE